MGLDFYRTEVWFQEIETLGKMLGTEEKAKEYMDFFKGYYDQVNETLATIPDSERKSVYFEGAKKYQTYGGKGYGSGIPNMIRYAGGKDLYPDREELAFEVNPEDVAERNPDVIIKGTSLGWNAQNDTEFKALRDEILNRSELSSTNAIKNGQVYVMSFDIAGGAGKKFGPVFLAKLLEHKVPDAVVAGITDQENTRVCFEKGVGTTVMLTVGGKLDTDNAKPLTITSKITNLYTPPAGAVKDVRTATLQVEGVTLVLTEERWAFVNLQQFKDAGIDPHRHKIVVVKLGYLHPELVDAAPRGYMVLTPGYTTLNLKELPFQNVIRPIFPLDEFEWDPAA